MESGNPSKASGVPPGAAPILALGACVGRYVVLGLVGKGGMGEVYAAYDPELDRKIALKLLRAESGVGVDPSEGRTRLLREAQAIARLTDPNVVTVFDVGTFADRVFLAMEFVDGTTLGYWLQAKARTWREVVTVFTAAGRGLAGAHKAGVVHRDFKPDNVMIGRDGEVRVMDFGLARTIEKPDDGAATAGEAQSMARPQVIGAASSVVTPWTAGDIDTRDLSREPASARPAQAGLSPFNSRLTVTGAMMGTPAYMAPEQFEDKAVDARSDQFSFCVALYEGLYGDRPFHGRNLQELSANVLAGRMRPVPPQAKIPGWLRRVLLRGMCVDRAERYPSMEALLEALGRDPARTRRRFTAAGVVVAAFATLGMGLVRAERKQRMRCLGADAKLAGVWELPGAKGGLSPRKEAIRRAFVATGKRYAADSFTVVMNALDRYVIEWTDMHRDSCEATNIRGEQSAEVLDLRTSCLHDRFSEVRALTAVFSGANSDVVAKSVEAVQAIRPVEQCADIAALRAVVRPPDDPAVRRAVADVRTALADVKAMAVAGRYKQALKDATRVLQDARATKYPPVIAEALLRRANLELDGGEFTSAAKNYEEAVWIAEAAGHAEVVAEATTALIFVVGSSQNRPVDAHRWARHSGAALEKLGPGHDVVAAWRANNLAIVLHSEGESEHALETLEGALRIKTRMLGEAHYDVALSLANIAFALHGMNRTTEAIEKNQRALDIFRRTVGPDHPIQAFALSNGAEFMNDQGRYDEAHRLAERAVVLVEREGDENHPDLAAALTAIGATWVGRERPRLAFAPLERALKIRLTRDPRPEGLGDTRFTLARALWQDGSSERAAELAEQARKDYRSSPLGKGRVAAVELWIDTRVPRPQRLTMR